MAQYKDVIVNAGAGGFGGPLVLKPDDKKNKVVNITGGVISPVSQKIAELTGLETKKIEEITTQNALNLFNLQCENV